MPITGTGVAAVAVGSLFAYAAISGKSVLQALYAITKGESPSGLTQAYPITDTQTAAANSGSIPGSTALQNIAGSGVTPAGTPAGSGAGAGAAAYQKYAFSLFPGYGWGADQQQPLINLWNGESGWDPTAYNPGRHTTNPDDSHAFGIPQALPASKMASAGSDWRTNGYTQIRWGLGYISQVYGSPAGAWAKWQARSPHWY